MFLLYGGGKLDRHQYTESLMAPSMAKTRGPSKLTRQQRAKAARVKPELIREVYEYWCSIMRPGKKRVPALDARRELKVAAAIADYGVDECLLAIDGCAKSDFHMGRNRQNKRYDDLELIFRDQDHIERFLGSSSGSSGELTW